MKNILFYFLFFSFSAFAQQDFTIYTKSPFHQGEQLVWTFNDSTISILNQYTKDMTVMDVVDIRVDYDSDLTQTLTYETTALFYSISYNKRTNTPIAIFYGMDKVDNYIFPKE